MNRAAGGAPPHGHRGLPLRRYPDPVRAERDHLGAAPTEPDIDVQPAVAVHGLGEHHGILECLAGSLAQVGRQGMRGVTHQGHPARCIRRERRQLKQVIVQYRGPPSRQAV